MKSIPITVCSILLLSCCSETRPSKTGDFSLNLESSVRILENQNEINKKNLDNLYYFFDLAKHNAPLTYGPLWKKAFQLKRASGTINKEIEELRGRSDPNELTSPLEMSMKLSEFQNLILTLPDSISLDTSELTVTFIASKSESWSQDSIMRVLDFALI